MSRPGDDDDGYYCDDAMCDGDHPYAGQTCADVEAALDAEEVAHAEVMAWAGTLDANSHLWGVV